MNFHDTRGLNSSSEDILFCWLIVFSSESVQVIQETEK